MRLRSSLLSNVYEIINGIEAWRVTVRLENSGSCMAPSFLSKLVKVGSPTSNRERRPGSSETSPRTSIGTTRSRSQSTSQSNVISPTTPTQASSLTSNKTTHVSTDSHITVHKADSHKSFESTDTASTQPNVTIVPPSPLIPGAELSDDDDDDEHIISTLISTPDSTTTTTTPSRPTSSQSSTPVASPSPSPSPTTSNHNLNSMAGGTNPAVTSNGSLSPGSFQVRKKGSNQSMKSVKNSVKKVTSDVNANAYHSKAATAPAEMDPDSMTKTAMVESPTDIKFPLPLPPVPPIPTEKPNGGSTANLNIQRQNTETSSINGKSSRPWRRSTTRKPTGLASAIAASGLAMANPVLSPSHQAQISPPALSPQQSINSAASKKSMATPGSPPYMSVSPAQSSSSQQRLRSRSTEQSSRSLKSKKSMNGTASSNGSRPRKASVSVNSDQGSESYGPGGDEVRPDYYSGLEDSSDESGSASDLDSDDLELVNDEMPVTGFAVASNKRNADFHELFPTVPEGDYLIEGE